MRRDLYAEVSAKIIAELERGAAPWVKPWAVTPGQNTPQNAVSNRPYSGCNVKDFLPFGGRGNDTQEAASKAKVEALLKDKGAVLWIQHDIVADAKLKKSPAYYE